MPARKGRARARKPEIVDDSDSEVELLYFEDAAQFTHKTRRESEQVQREKQDDTDSDSEVEFLDFDNFSKTGLDQNLTAAQESKGRTTSHVGGRGRGRPRGRPRGRGRGRSTRGRGGTLAAPATQRISRQRAEPDVNPGPTTEELDAKISSIPIILEYEGFSSLLAPVNPEGSTELSAKYDLALPLFEDGFVAGYTLHEVFEQIRRTSKLPNFPFREDEDLSLNFKELNLSLIESSVYAYELTLSDVVDAFLSLKQSSTKDSPTCLHLELGHEKSFISKFDEIKRGEGDFNEDRVIDNDVGDENMKSFSVGDEIPSPVKKKLDEDLSERETDKSKKIDETPETQTSPLQQKESKEFSEDRSQDLFEDANEGSSGPADVAVAIETQKATKDTTEENEGLRKVISETVIESNIAVNVLPEEVEERKPARKNRLEEDDHKKEDEDEDEDEPIIPLPGSLELDNSDEDPDLKLAQVDADKESESSDQSDEDEDEDHEHDNPLLMSEMEELIAFAKKSAKTGEPQAQTQKRSLLKTSSSQEAPQKKVKLVVAETDD